MATEFDGTTSFTAAESAFIPGGFAGWEDGFPTDEFWTAKDGTTETA